jgi:hypothetical protein
MQTTLPDWQKTAAVDLVPALQPTISTWKLIVTLFKLRIVTLLLMAAYRRRGAGYYGYRPGQHLVAAVVGGVREHCRLAAHPASTNTWNESGMPA